MNRFVRRVLGEGEGTRIDPREFILNTPDRPEIEVRYEQVFADILGFTTARCRSNPNGEYLDIELQFDLAQRQGTELGHLHFILRDLPREFQLRILPRSTLMTARGSAAKLVFRLEPAN
jgi:hypothetical protein